jgi:hypothetical protein
MAYLALPPAVSHPVILYAPPNKLNDPIDPISWEWLNTDFLNTTFDKIICRTDLRYLSVAVITWGYAQGVLKNDLIFFTQEYLDPDEKSFQSLSSIICNRTKEINFYNGYDFNSVNFLNLTCAYPYTTNRKLISYLRSEFHFRKIYQVQVADLDLLGER